MSIAPRRTRRHFDELLLLFVGGVEIQRIIIVNVEEVPQLAHIGSFFASAMRVGNIVLLDMLKLCTAFPKADSFGLGLTKRINMRGENDDFTRMAL